jgi:hypothetical protein
MSTIKSSAEDLTLNADGSGNDIKFQSNAVEVGSLTAEGVLTATSFAGSGASLTGIATPITALNNATESELVTVGSTTTELDAESGLTYNGSTLAVTGRGTFSDGIAIADGTTEDSILVSADSGSHNLAKWNATNSSAGGQSMMQFFRQGGLKGSISTDNSNTAFNTSSDYRLKENVNYDWDATIRIKQLKPARFNWIADDTNTLQDGFLAHEVTSIVPEATIGVKDATETYTDDEGIEQTRILPQGIDQSKLVPLLVKTIQELEARITALEA